MDRPEIPDIVTQPKVTEVCVSVVDSAGVIIEDLVIGSKVLAGQVYSLASVPANELIRCKVNDSRGYDVFQTDKATAIFLAVDGKLVSEEEINALKGIDFRYTWQIRIIQ